MESTRRNVDWNDASGWEWRAENGDLHRADGPAAKVGTDRYDWALFGLTLDEDEHARLVDLPEHLLKRVVDEMSEATTKFFEMVDDDESPEAQEGVLAARGAILRAYEAAAY